MRQGLNWVRKQYNNIPVIITENGYSDNSGTTNDTHRIDYYRAYIDEVLKGKKTALYSLILHTLLDN